MLSRPYKIIYLTIGYVTALLLIAALSVSGHLIIRLTLKQQESDARIVNLSGRQRMLSQLLTKSALLMTQSNDPAAAERHKHVIATELKNWTRIQAGLSLGDKGLGIPKNDDENVAYYFEKMEPDFKKMKGGLEDLLKTAPGGTTGSGLSSKPLSDIVESSPRYLELMDKTTFEFQKKADERVMGLKYNETVILLFVLSLLSAEAFFIFRPMIGKVRESYGEIESANEELQKAKEGLEETVRERVKELVAVNARLEGEIAERKRNEDFLVRANREKGALVHEIHHRVKNNLQVVASILRLKSRKIKNPEDLAAFKESDALIRSISMIHEKLYAKDDVSEINMGEYLTELVGDLPRAYGVAPEKIRWTVSAEDVSLGPDKAIPCGLIANELATNVIKYAFPGDASGEAKIAFFRSGENTLEIVVSDNGVGFQPDRIGVKPDSVGLELITRIVKDQLDGTMEINSGENKTEIRVRFREAD